MEQKFLVAAACGHLRTGPHHEKLLADKRLFPLGGTVGFLNAATEIQVKFYDSGKKLVISNEAKIEEIKDTFCLKLTNVVFEAALNRLRNTDFVTIVFEGSTERATVILCFLDGGQQIFETLESQDPSLRVNFHLTAEQIETFRMMVEEFDSFSSQAATTTTAAPQAQTQVKSQSAPVTIQPVQNPIVSQPQPQSPPASVATTPEVSVAEAARQARIAKAVREAKEKAERDNPPPPQQ